MALFPDEVLVGFGPSRFRIADLVPVTQSVRGKRSGILKKHVREHAPQVPGVYGMFDAHGRVIYIGKAKNLRSRLLSYFREQSRDRKAGKIIGRTRLLAWEHCADEFSALLRELELIRRFRPRFNVIGQPGRERYVYLCLGRDPAHVYFSKDPKGKDLAVYGPFVGRGRIADAVRAVNLHFGLRDCANTTNFHFSDQAKLFPAEQTAKCIRYELGSCLGPCAGFCSRKQYHTAIQKTKAFLDGRDDTLFRQYVSRMKLAAEQMQYEQAAVARDKLELFKNLRDRLKFLRTARKSTSFIYPLAGPSGEMLWYLIHGGEVRSVVREPVDATTATLAQEQLRAVFEGILPGTGVLERCVDSVLIVTSWFRKRPDEHDRLLKFQDALAKCNAVRSIAPTESRDSAS